MKVKECKNNKFIKELVTLSLIAVLYFLFIMIQMS